MKQQITIFLLLAILLTQQGCRRMQPDFLEIVVVKETQKDCTTEVVCYLKRTELLEAGVSEDDVRKSVMLLLNDVGHAVSKAVAETIMPGNSGDITAHESAERGEAEQKRKIQSSGMTTLLARGIFMEGRTIRGKEIIVTTRGVVRMPQQTKSAIEKR